MLGDKIRKLLTRLRNIHRLLQPKTLHMLDEAFEELNDIEEKLLFSEPLIRELNIKIEKIAKEKEQLKQYALLGKACDLAIKRFHSISVYGSGKLCVLLLGNKFNHMDLLDWYQQQLEKEGKDE